MIEENGPESPEESEKQAEKGSLYRYEIPSEFTEEAKAYGWTSINQPVVPRSSEPPRTYHLANAWITSGVTTGVTVGDQYASYTATARTPFSVEKIAVNRATGAWEPWVYPRPRALDKLKVADRGLELESHLCNARACCDRCGKFYGQRLRYPAHPRSKSYLGCCEICEDIEMVRLVWAWGSFKQALKTMRDITKAKLARGRIV